MRKYLLTVMITLAFIANAKAQTYQNVLDTVYARNVCIEDMVNNYVSNTDRPEYDKKGNLVKPETGSNSWIRYLSTWPTGTRKLAYYVHMPAGHARADMLITTRANQTPTVHVNFIDPVTNDTLYKDDILIPEPGKKQTVECLPDINIEKDGWYRLDFYCENGNDYLGRFDYITFQRESKDAICTPRIYSALATYLNSWRTSNTAAPAGASYDCVYLEVQAPEDEESINSYISTMNLLGGYLGIQSCLNGDLTPRNYFKDYWHNVIFSMWDNGDTDKTPYLPEYLRSGGFDKHEMVKFNRFGNEGTGIQAMKGNGDWWQPGKWVQMLFTCRPEDITVTLQDQAGNDSITLLYNNTIVSLWYKMSDETEWTYHATLRKSGMGNYVDTWGAFLENWSPTAGQFKRTALFRNCYLHSIASGKWYNCNTTTTGFYYDRNRLRADLRDRRLDMEFGVKDDNKTVYMSAGGFFTMHNGVNKTISVPLATSDECVDTIDLNVMRRRVDQAIVHYEDSVMIKRVTDAIRSIDKMKEIAKEVVDGVDKFNGYRKADAQALIDAYDDGNCTSISVLRNALRNLAGSAEPLKYSSVLRKENIGTFRAYQLYQATGEGVVAGTTVDGVNTLRAVNSENKNAVEAAKEFVPVYDPMANWVVLRFEEDDTYYLYNIGLGKYLDMSQATLLGNKPVAVEISKATRGFSIKQGSWYLSVTPTSSAATITRARSAGLSSYFELRDNITEQPSDEYIYNLIDQTKMYNDLMAELSDVSDILSLPEGVVGSLADAADRAKLEQAYNGGDLNAGEAAAVIEMLKQMKRIEFAPEKVVYRVRSASSGNKSKPYMTMNDDLTLSITSADNGNASQLWRFVRSGEGYLIYSQGKGLGEIALSNSKRVTATDEPVVAYLTDLGNAHFTITGAANSAYSIGTSSTNLSTASSRNERAQWFLEPVATYEVTSNAGGFASLCVDFDVILPDDVTAYVATSVTADGVLKLEQLESNQLETGKPVLLFGAPNSVFALNAAAPFLTSMMEMSMLRGTLLSETVEQGSVYTLAAEGSEAFMQPLAQSVLPANEVYVPVDDVPVGLAKLTFDFDPTGIFSLPAQASSAKTYDVQGRQVGELTKGILIRDGKKHVNR
ncbi:MAG: DUF3472 domain-containing protein [Prevotella sp.]|nr:DUF3472 domain-containing protein [Prevotella sp.]